MALFEYIFYFFHGDLNLLKSFLLRLNNIVKK